MFYRLHGVISLKMYIFKVFLVRISVELPSVVVDLSGICHLTAPKLKRLVAGFPPRRPGFDPGSTGICDGQSGAGAGFLRVLRFPLPIFIPKITPQSSSIVWGWYNRPVVAQYQVDSVSPQ
jgi:hypothetical protein